MHVIIKSLLLTGLLAACGTPEVSRYHDTENLERPPKVVSTNTNKEQNTVDNSSIPKKNESTGLGKDVVSLNNPSQITIKQSFGDAWNTLNRALKQSGLKITDHERNKGLYYVTRASSEESGFFGKLTTFLANDSSIYQLVVKQEGSETSVTGVIANATEQSAADKDGTQHSGNEGLEDLMQQLFKTLRDDLKEE